MLHKKEHAESEDEEIIMDNDDEPIEVKIKTLTKKLKECQKEKEENLTGWQRARAEMVNYKKGAADDIEKKAERALVPLVRNLVDILDAFDSALSMEQNGGQKSEGMASGIALLKAKLESILAQSGVHFIESVGEKFDPEFHEAVSMEETHDELKDQTIASVVQRGVLLHKTIVRPAKVVIFNK